MRKFKIDMCDGVYRPFAMAVCPYWNGVLSLGEHEYNRVVSDLLNPSEPTEAVKRGAALLKRLYGEKS